MDQSTLVIRTENWRRIVQDCQNRPSGMTAKQWLSENNISVKSYYYWLRKFRKQHMQQIKQSLPMEHKPSTEVSFMEIPGPVINQTISTDVVKAHIGELEIELNESISDEFLIRLLKAARYAG